MDRISNNAEELYCRVPRNYKYCHRVLCSAGVVKTIMYSATELQILLKSAVECQSYKDGAVDFQRIM